MGEAMHAPRLLRHTQGTTETLSQNKAHQFASQHALVHYASGAVFSFIPKNACTSLRVSLAMANGTIASTDDWTWVHKNNATFSASLTDLARASVTAVILRCPFRRLASTFLDKIVSRSGELWTLHRRSRDMIDPDRFTFRDFVGWIGKPGLLRADIHWRPQSDFLVYDDYDHVFGMEGVADFALFFEAATGQPFVDARGFSGHTTSVFETLDGDCHADTPLIDLLMAKAEGRLPSAHALYDDELAGRVARLFADDIALHEGLLGRSALLFPNADSKA
jgi:hypothetical protein